MSFNGVSYFYSGSAIAMQSSLGEHLKENEQKQTAERLIRINDVLARVPISRSSWYAGIKDGRFPPPVKLGVAFRHGENETCSLLLDRGTG